MAAAMHGGTHFLQLIAGYIQSQVEFGLCSRSPGAVSALIGHLS